MSSLMMEPITKKVQYQLMYKRSKSLLFKGCPDEIVLIILSYGTMNDIRSTRIWQTENVKLCTETRTKEEAAEKNNLDIMKWIYNCIENTTFIFKTNFCKKNFTGKKQDLVFE